MTVGFFFFFPIINILMKNKTVTSCVCLSICSRLDKQMTVKDHLNRTIPALPNKGQYFITMLKDFIYKETLFLNRYQITIADIKKRNI